MKMMVPGDKPMEWNEPTHKYKDRVRFYVDKHNYFEVVPAKDGSFLEVRTVDGWIQLYPVCANVVRLQMTKDIPG